MQIVNNAIIQIVHQKIMGSVIDAIEYYLVSRLYNKNVYLLLVSIYNNNSTNDNKYRKILCDLIYNRYSYNKEFEDNIKIIDKVTLVRTRLKSAVILDWGTIPHIKGLVNAHNLIIITELSDSNSYILDKTKYKNLTYYAEMPFVYKDIQYRMKFAFDLYPKLIEVKEGLYINSPNNSFEEDIELQQLAKTFNKPILLKSFTHRDNLFSYFDSYLYYHNNKYFDPHPRLFHECYFYNKEIHYINKYNIQDGSYYRYNDLIKTGLTNRILDKNDEIIRQLI